MTDKIDVEATTRAWLAHCWTNPFDVQAAGRALALIDQLTAERDKALAWAKEQHKCADGYAARAEQAEASLADALAKVEAMQGVMVEADEALAGFVGEIAGKARIAIREHLPAKVEPDPLADAVNEAWGWRNPHSDVADRLRAAIAARGGTISFEGV